MDIRIIDAPENSPLPRIYIATITMKNFHGHAGVEAHLFREGAAEQEMEALRGKNLVGPPEEGIPPELLAGANEDGALACILEAFTREEAEQLAAYLQNRYADQIESLLICPMQLPVPLGIGPLAAIPEGKKSGFINFAKVADYPLPFSVKAYFDLGESNPQS